MILKAKPILKWAGGKGQLLPQIRASLPDRIIKYAEPFVGSGAVFLDIAQTFAPPSLYISDRNGDLILLYQVVQAEVEKLIDLLLEIQEKFASLTRAEQSIYFYQIRQEFNARKLGVDLSCPHKYDAILHSAQLIFLNRTCFNGLFRVNGSGNFNVPFGDYKQPRVCDSGNLRAVSQILEKALIKLADFAEVLDYCDGDTFVYFDPPYRPITRTASFNAYSVNGFDDGEQRRLADFCKCLDRQGVRWLLSNSDPHNGDVNDDFFDNLYGEYVISRVFASRMINSNGNKRGAITEILVRNY